MQAKKINIEWNPDLSIYASEPFLKAVGDEYGWIGGFDDSGNVRCILPYTIIKKGIFRLARFRVETIVIGDGLDIQEEKTFLKSSVKFLAGMLQIDRAVAGRTLHDQHLHQGLIR